MKKRFEPDFEVICECGEVAVYNTSYIPEDLFEDEEVLENVEEVHSFFCLSCGVEFIVITLINDSLIILERELDVEFED